MMRLRLLFLGCATIFITSSCGIFVPSDDYARGGRTETGRETRAPRSTDPDGTQTLRRQIIDDASSLIGTRYRYGGVAPRSGMDCSGLLNYVFQNVGITLRRSSREQVKDGFEIKKREARPGDLVFFARGGQVFHVAMITEYDGENMYVIHSTSSKGVIRQEILHNSYWSPKIKTFRNVISTR